MYGLIYKKITVGANYFCPIGAASQACRVWSEKVIIHLLRDARVPPGAPATGPGGLIHFIYFSIHPFVTQPAPHRTHCFPPLTHLPPRIPLNFIKLWQAPYPFLPPDFSAMMNVYLLLPRRRRSTCWYLVGLLLAGMPLLAQPVLVKDVNKTDPSVHSDGSSSDGLGQSNLTSVNGLLYFWVDDAVHGNEIWRSNGTAAGTFLLRDIFPGTGDSKAEGFTLMNGVVYFVADNGMQGPELWKTDGTTAGTSLVKDIYPGAVGGNPGGFVNLNGVLYFGANDGVHGRELWKSDGTAAGTVLVKDICPGADGSVVSLADRNGTLLLSAYEPNTGYELWKSNGTAAGTVLVKDINPGTTGSQLSGLTTASGAVFFAANDGVHGRELWKSDGTAAGTVLVKDIEEGHYYGPEDGFVFDSTPLHLVNFNGTVYFSAFRGDQGRELWKSNGTAAGTVLVKDIDPEGFSDTYRDYGEWIPYFIGFSSNPNFMTPVNGALYLGAERELTGDYAGWRRKSGLWKSDGTEAGTQLVKETPRVSGVAGLGTVVYFTAGGQSGYTDLWKSDGTEAGTVLVKRTGNPYTKSSYASRFTKSGNLLYFTAYDTPIDYGNTGGSEVWRSDGTDAGTFMVKDIVPGPESSSPQDLTDVNGTLFFTAGNALWKTNGTEATTVQLQGGAGRSLFNANGVLYYTRLVDYSSGRSELWKSDGTIAGTVRVYTDVPLVTHFALLNGTVYFAGNGGLWKTNGTTAGTVPVRSGVGIAELISVNGTLYFRGTGVNGAELWKSNGTGAGTVQLKDINAGTPSGFPESLTDVNGKLFFVATSPTYGIELWKSDGTAAGTVLVKDIVPGTGSSLYSTAPDPTKAQYFNVLHNVNGTLFFVAHAAGLGDELWKSDGTAAGTTLVKDLVAGPESAFYMYYYDNGPAGSFAAVNGALYFTTSGSYYGLPPTLWRTDGTAAGTQVVKSFTDAWITNRINNLTNVNGTLFFRVDDGRHGVEPWKVNLTNCVMPTASTALAGSTVCLGSNGTLTVKASQAGVHYTVYLGDAAVGQPVKSTGGDLVLTVPAVSLSTGSYTFNVRAFGCTEATLTQTATISVRNPLAAPAAAGKTISSGQTATLTASGAPAGATYRWYAAASGGTPAGERRPPTLRRSLAAYHHLLRGLLRASLRRVAAPGVTVTVKAVAVGQELPGECRRQLLLYD
jgi:ELWxxDGT repeat protein